MDCSISYNYQVRAVDAADYPGVFSSPIDLVCETSAVGDLSVPSRAELSQSWPNPFSPLTTIQFELENAGHVEISIFNVRGERVRVLLGSRRSVGRHEVTWDGRDDAGGVLASGVYFYRIDAPGLTETRKLILAR